MDQQQQPPLERNETTNNTSQSNTEFSLKFTESGGLSNRYLLLSYNSKTKTITSSTDVSGSNVKHKQLSESKERELIEAIRTNEFFNTRTDYPPEKEDESLTHILWPSQWAIVCIRQPGLMNPTGYQNV